MFVQCVLRISSLSLDKRNKENILSSRVRTCITLCRRNYRPIRRFPDRSLTERHTPKMFNLPGSIFPSLSFLGCAGLQTTYILFKKNRVSTKTQISTKNNVPINFYARHTRLCYNLQYTFYFFRRYMKKFTAS